MDKSIRRLQGSPSRDRFKWLHKQKAPSNFYALDSDLELVSKRPWPFIVARLDFKRQGDSISFSEVIAYNQLIAMPMPYRIPVYIIECLTDIQGDPDCHLFNIYRYDGGDPYPHPPKTTLTLLLQKQTWEGLVQWERKLRESRGAEVARWKDHIELEAAPPTPMPEAG